MHRLLTDIRSFMSKELYGAAGETVVVVVERGNVVIVEAMNGNRFPVNANQLTCEEIEIIATPAALVTQFKKTQKGKGKVENSNTLF